MNEEQSQGAAQCGSTPNHQARAARAIEVDLDAGLELSDVDGRNQLQLSRLFCAKALVSGGGFLSSPEAHRLTGRGQLLRCGGGGMAAVESPGLV